MGLTGFLAETDDEGIPSLEYFEELEDGIVLVQEEVLGKLRAVGVSGDILNKIRFEFVFRVQQI